MARFAKIAAFALVLMLAGCHSAFRDAMQRGDDFAATGDWDRAAQAYEQASGLDPDDEEARLAVRQAHREQAKVRVYRATQLLQAGQAREALAPFADALRLDPQSFLARQGLEEAKRQVVFNSHQALDAGRFKESFDLARAVLAVDPSHGEARQLEAAARDRIAEAAFVRGQSLETSGATALALVDYGEALEYRPDHAQAAARWTEARKALREQVTFFVALKNFDGDEKADELGSDVDANVLGAGIDPALPLRIVDNVPKSKKFKIQGMRLGGVFSNYAYKKSSSRSSRTCDYVCGKDLVANPAYASAEANMRTSQAMLGTAEGRLSAAKAAVGPAERARDAAKSSADAKRIEKDRAQQDLDRCRSRGQSNGCTSEEQRKSRADQDASMADSEVQRAEQALQSARAEVSGAETDLGSKRNDAASQRTVFDQTPSQVQVDRHCAHTYAVDTFTVHGEVDCALHGEGLYDTESLLNGGVTGRVTKQDDTFPAQAGVCAEVASGDPLNVPSEAEVRRLVIASAVEATQRELLGTYARYRAGYLARARAAAADRRNEDAADGHVRFLLTLAADDASDSTKEALAAIAQLRQVDDKAVRIAVFGPAPERK